MWACKVATAWKNYSNYYKRLTEITKYAYTAPTDHECHQIEIVSATTSGLKHLFIHTGLLQFLLRIETAAATTNKAENC